ncbi:MAG: NAD-dependent epimerase/dehydratase family protein [Acidobacteria bacterium]|nr:NAD-dependent epimerase/dehydratase family protein [Acidobacteriota bacterium]
MTRHLILGHGFIGHKLALRLAGMGLPVRTLGHGAPPANLPGNIDWINADIRNGSALDHALSDAGIVYHLFSATVPSSAEQNPLLDQEGNVALTLELLGRAVKAGVRKLVFMSSGGTVYGVPQYLPIPETAATHPISIYGASKLAIENYLHCYQHLYGLDYTVLRLSNPYGEGQRLDRKQGAITTFMAKAVNGEEITIWGDGGVVRDYLHVDDVIEALVVAAHATTRERVFNIGSGIGMSLNEILAAMQPLFSEPLTVRYLESRPFDVRANVLDISRAREQLGWHPRIQLSEGLGRLLEWMRSPIDSPEDARGGRLPA